MLRRNSKHTQHSRSVGQQRGWALQRGQHRCVRACASGVGVYVGVDVHVFVWVRCEKVARELRVSGWA